jgi:hypothetical protein
MGKEINTRGPDVTSLYGEVHLLAVDIQNPTSFPGQLDNTRKNKK